MITIRGRHQMIFKEGYNITLKKRELELNRKSESIKNTVSAVMEV